MGHSTSFTHEEQWWGVFSTIKPRITLYNVFCSYVTLIMLLVRACAANWGHGVWRMWAFTGHESDTVKLHYGKFRIMCLILMTKSQDASVLSNRFKNLSLVSPPNFSKYNTKLQDCLLIINCCFREIQLNTFRGHTCVYFLPANLLLCTSRIFLTSHVLLQSMYGSTPSSLLAHLCPSILPSHKCVLLFSVVYWAWWIIDCVDRVW